MLATNLALVVAPLAAAFAISLLAELVLLFNDQRIWIAVAKSAKAIIIPALIATYALIIASIIGVGGMNMNQ